MMNSHVSLNLSLRVTECLKNHNNVVIYYVNIIPVDLHYYR